jgi:hypothetical protein
MSSGKQYVVVYRYFKATIAAQWLEWLEGKRTTQGMTCEGHVQVRSNQVARWPFIHPLGGHSYIRGSADYKFSDLI